MAIKITAITSTRADFGLLSGLMEALNKDPNFELEVMATGTHLSPQHGYTKSEIEEAGFKLSSTIEMDLNDDSPLNLSLSSAELARKITKILNHTQPKAIIILGDRFEILPIAFVAVMLGVKIIHIHGGEVTLGSFDNKMRYAISSLSDLHLVATKKARSTLLNMGFTEQNVVLTGAPGVEHALKMTKADRTEIEQKFGIKFRLKNILFTFHPETLSTLSVERQIDITLSALSNFKDIGIFISTPNADPGNQKIRSALVDFKKANNNVFSMDNMGHYLYLSLLSEVNAVVGNSSSGIIEAPAVSTITVNIGSRQKGREQAPTILNTSIEKNDIIKAVSDALSSKKQIDITQHPYYCADTCGLMVNSIKSFLVER